MFTLSSDDIADGRTLPSAHVHVRAGGEDLSPHLAWSGAPEGTRGYLVTCWDPDAPRRGGFWHWIVADVPADVAGLPRGAGAPDGSWLPPGARHLRSGFGTAGYGGAAPPPGHGPHRYVFAVEALDTERLAIGPDASPEQVRAAAAPHVLARAEITPRYER